MKLCNYFQMASTMNSQDSAYYSVSRSSTRECSPQETPEVPVTVEQTPEIVRSPSPTSPTPNETKHSSVDDDLQSLGDDETGAVIIDGPKDTTVLKGQEAVLKATFKGFPEPEVTWYKKVSQLLRLI